ncbi:MAG: hypothetical protein LBK13_00080 [Spirochaetales bacterium]|nr:hypothetical protein [Spirochaetales bacterium]
MISRWICLADRRGNRRACSGGEGNYREAGRSPGFDGAGLEGFFLSLDLSGNLPVFLQVWRDLPQNGDKSRHFYIGTIPEAVWFAEPLY